MINSSIDGNFSETTYDESVLSALEAKMNRYLTSSLISEKNLTAEKDKIKSLISDISHQTKTPITNISLYTQLILEYPNLPEEYTDMAKQISTQAEKLRFLVGALVKTSRLETGIISVAPVFNSISNLITCACEEVKEKANKKNISIIMEHNDLTACFDEKWTSEAFYNILDNAVKYTADYGTISITAASYDLFCRIDIADNGIGISEREINKVFQRFYRSQAVNQYEGVGIGLFLAREIIAAQGGYIKVKSELQIGSIFSVFLRK